MASPDVLTEMLDYIGFEPYDAQLLMDIGPYVRPEFAALIDEFYVAIEQNPRAMAVFQGPDQIAHQKTTLLAWLESLFKGIYDEAYLVRRERIGRAHVRIGLDQRFMLGGMNLIRESLHEAHEAATPWEPDHKLEGHRAIDKICDVELAIMLETYREDSDDRLRKNERLATLGQLSASIGHELRNPLAVMETSLHLLRRRVTGGEKTNRHLARIGNQIALCGSIISDLMQLARDEAPQRSSTDFVELVRLAVADLVVPEPVCIELDLPEGIAPIEVDAGQLRQVVVNVVQNAVGAAVLDGPGTVWVSLKDDGARLVLVVEDDGEGIEPGTRHRLFEPLFTTRAKGIGLGLALCKSVLAAHHGEIQALDRDGGGARFEVRLPRTEPTS